MKKIILLFVMSTIAMGAFAQTGKSKPPKTDSTAKKVYTCPMHPEVISDKPGKCPKCGMDLVEKKTPPKKKESMKMD
jgi:Cu(I)/Ag(I) efflux system membrane fusion protein